MSNGKPRQLVIGGPYPLHTWYVVLISPSPSATTFGTKAATDMVFVCISITPQSLVAPHNLHNPIPDCLIISPTEVDLRIESLKRQPSFSESPAILTEVDRCGPLRHIWPGTPPKGNLGACLSWKASCQNPKWTMKGQYSWHHLELYGIPWCVPQTPWSKYMSEYFMLCRFASQNWPFQAQVWFHGPIGTCFTQIQVVLRMGLWKLMVSFSPTSSMAMQLDDVSGHVRLFVESRLPNDHWSWWLCNSYIVMCN